MRFRAETEVAVTLTDEGTVMVTHHSYAVDDDVFLEMSKGRAIAVAKAIIAAAKDLDGEF